MSGHSKWHNIKLKKGKVDAQRGALFTKLSKEIILAAKSGSADPEANYRLKMAVEKARENNVPQENIKRAISRASGGADEKQIEELRYEGYGPAGVAVIVDAATDNRNRTAGELRFLFSRNDGTLGESGSVGWMFESHGVVEVKPRGMSEDALTEHALVDGVVDVRFDTDQTEIITAPTALMAVKDKLEAAGLAVAGARLTMEAKQTTHPSEADTAKVITFLEALEDHEDVQNVFSNAEFDDAALEALA
jgi:YebC/PmpR family DNA-binding regulatory protein